MRAKIISGIVVLLLATSASAQSRLPRNEGLVSLDFHDVDIADVVKSVSEITGKNFVLDDRVRGKVTIISPSPVSVDEAYKAFLSALEIKNLCTVESGSVTKIVPLRECKERNTPVEDDDQERCEGDQPITKIVKLKNISANEIKQPLNPLVSRTGTITAYGPTNSLVISDTCSNIKRLMKIVEKLDRENFKSTVEVIPLKDASAVDVAEKLNLIFEQEKGRSTARRGNDVQGGADVSRIIPDVRTNSLIVVATREGIERVLDLVGEIARPVEMRSEQNYVHVRPLQHADAADLANILTSLITGVPTAKKKAKDDKKSSPAQSPAFGQLAAAPGTEPLPWEEESAPYTAPIAAESGAIVRKSGGMFQDEVRVVADPATNSLIVTASPVDYQALTPVIDQLDKRRAQVFVETLIMEVNITKGYQVGLSGHGGAQAGDAKLFGATHLNAMPSAAVAQNPAMLANPANPLGLVLGGLSSKTFSIGGLTIPVQGALFQALQTNGVLDVLSAPNILTTDNKKAEILVGQEIPFIASQGRDVNNQPINQVQRQKVGINLAVTPKVADGNEVTLDVEQKVQDVANAVVPGAVNDIVTNERSAKTTVIVQNGQTVVIGGLIRDLENKTVRKVPLLGDVPLLGHLFRNTEVKRDKTNLVIFLTPHVIHDPNDLTRISVKKNNERRRFNKKHGFGENPALYDYDLDKGLNMAAPPEQKVKRDEPKKRRFDYDKPIEPETEAAPAEDELAQKRRMPRRSEPKTEFAEKDVVDDIAELPRTRRASGARPASGNPFSDVRPPSSR